MFTEVMAWNTNEAMALPDQMPAAVDNIRRLGANIVILCDAYSLQNPLHGSQPEVLDEARRKLFDDGYRIAETNYGAADNWRHDRNMMMLCRDIPMQASRMMQGTRQGLVGQTNDLTIVGTHGDDRSSPIRQNQFASIFQQVDLDSPLALIGDVNDLDPNDPLSSLIGSRTFYNLASWLPHNRLSNLSRRASPMAWGKVLSKATRAGLHDADPTRTKTFPAKHPLLRPDHLFVNHLVKVENFRVGQSTGHIDHLPIQARLIW